MTSILVVGKNVWMATARGGEYAATPHALLRWDITSQQLDSKPLDGVVNQIACYQGDLYLATGDGIEVVTKDGFRRFMIDITSDSKYSVKLRQVPGR